MVNKKRSQEILNELEARFQDGDRLSIEQIIEEYFKTTSTFSYLIAKQTVKRYIQTLKNRFTKGQGVWFGNLDDLGNYGVCQTEEEYRYSLLRYYSFIKGTLGRAVQLRGEAKEKGLLKGFRDMPFLLPAPVEERKKS